MTIKIQNNPVIYEDRTLRVASGSTAERPESPEAGMIRFNTDIDAFEGYEGTDWVIIGEPPPPPPPPTPSPIVVAYAWGGGGNGQLGDGTNVNRSSPVTVVGGVTNWSQVSSWNHSLGVTEDGIAYAWGIGILGQLGTGTAFPRSSPVTVVGGITNWKKVAASPTFSMGLTQDGRIFTWGNSLSGQLGDGTTVAKSSPVMVVGGITNWIEIGNGRGHGLGITQDGIAYAWGDDQNGRLGLGLGGRNDRSSPATVVGGITNWSQVDGGDIHSLGLTEDGIAYAWGGGGSVDFGQLGIGTTDSRNSPVTVVGGITNWSQVSAGYRHSLGLTEDGVAYAWGNGLSGRLGDDTTVDRSSPVTVVGGITNWSQVSAGNGHSLGLTEDGIAYAWGGGGGRLGDGTTVDRSSPVTVVGGITNWSQVSAGNAHSLGLGTTD